MRPIVYEELKVGDEVVTRDGRKGRVICTDVKSVPPLASQPICCLIPSEECGSEVPEFYFKDGGWVDHKESPEDIFLPPKKEYVNLYRDKRTGIYWCTEVALEGDEEVRTEIEQEDPAYTFIKTVEIEL